MLPSSPRCLSRLHATSSLARDAATDHVSVKSDLSDLAASLRWLKEHDDKAQLIVENANALAVKYLHKEGILDYMHLCLHAVASRYAFPCPDDA